MLKKSAGNMTVAAGSRLGLRCRANVTLGLCAALISLNAHGGVYCNESVTQVIVHQDGGVYFQTDQTCSDGWCKANWGAASRNAYAMLLTAKTTGRRLQMYWDALGACSQKNPALASPHSLNLSE